MKIYIQDIIKAGYCRKGAMQWFIDRGYDYEDILKSGLEADELLKWNDEQANKIVEVVRSGIIKKADDRI